MVEDGDNTYGGRCVVNPSGGLISKGHPLGATGLAQCAELNWQVRREGGRERGGGGREGVGREGGREGVGREGGRERVVRREGGRRVGWWEGGREGSDASGTTSYQVGRRRGDCI